MPATYTSPRSGQGQSRSAFGTELFAAGDQVDIVTSFGRRIHCAVVEDEAAAGIGTVYPAIADVLFGVIPHLGYRNAGHKDGSSYHRATEDEVTPLHHGRISWSWEAIIVQI